MPKIEVHESLFTKLAGKTWADTDELERDLTCAKAELDEKADPSLPASERTLKIELNDTNRPDLWSTAGVARQLRVWTGGKASSYDFFSTAKEAKKAKYRVVVEESVRKVRPFLAGFVATGKEITDESLKDAIQTQEKLAWNFGRKRRSVSMGLYRISRIQWPIHYKGVDPESVSFVPLQWDRPMNLREILREHPKGKEYAFIQEHEDIHPLLVDDKDEVLSYPPIINSADLGAVKVSDRDLFVEVTGTDLASVNLAVNIMACDLADQGYTVEPVLVEYAYDTPWGKSITTPYAFQEECFCSLERVERFLGEKLSADDCVKALRRMDCTAEACTAPERGSKDAVPGVRAGLPPYRNDYLHAADVVEDIMIGRGLDSFKPLQPSDFTIGRLTPLTLSGRRVKEVLIGLGYQEMIYNYLGSGKDYIERMCIEGKDALRISNPMTENYEYVRPSILPSLLSSEAVSANAVFPHRIFEVGKVAYRCDEENYGSRTRQHLGFLQASGDANYNIIASQVNALMYYLSREYKLAELDDGRFIPGRAAAVIWKGKKIGVFGEIHPQVLENWGLATPCIACEIDIEELLLNQ